MGPEERKRVVPRVVMFGGKAFATYAQAKRIVKLVTDVGSVVNNDPDIGNLLKVIIPQALKLISLSLTIDPLSLSWFQLPMFPMV
jgi:starch phosphorylase